MPDLRALAIFVKVAERLSFVRAATELGITQSGVSNAISRLENEIGTPLLARTTRRVSLTEHGAAYFERCRAALAELEEAELVLKNAQLRPSGNLHIDVPVVFGRLKVAPLLGAFQARYPDISVRMTFNDRNVDFIDEGIDVSVRFGVLQDSNLIARRLSSAKLSVVGAPAYFAKFGRPKRVEDLAGTIAWRSPFARRGRPGRGASPKAASKPRSTRRAISASATASPSATPPAPAAAWRNCRISSSTSRSPAASLFPSWTSSHRRRSRSGWSIRRPGTCRRRCACSSTSWRRNSKRALACPADQHHRDRRHVGDHKSAKKFTTTNGSTPR